MSEGLRAEDVKEALARASKGTVWYTDEEPWRTIVAAARAWLASQEQTPDYEAAAKVYWESKASQGPYEARSEREKDEAIRPVARAIVDAALVGFR